MTVFKCYMKILKKNIGLVSIYLLIFFSIAMVLQASAKKEHLEDFEKTRIDLAIADQDTFSRTHEISQNHPQCIQDFHRTHRNAGGTFLQKCRIYCADSKKFL